MMNTKKIAVALAVLACSSGAALAAQNVDVQVKGKITPAACNVFVAGGGIIDYGDIKSSQLAANGFTPLDHKELPIHVECDAPIHVALKPIDQRSASAANVDTSEIHSRYAQGFAGLGNHNQKSIGVYSMGLSDPYVETDDDVPNADVPPPEFSGPAILTSATSHGGEWTSKHEGVTSFYRSGNVPAFIAIAGEEEQPTAFRSLEATINVQAYINKASELDLTSAISLDGMSTIELFYL